MNIKEKLAEHKPDFAYNIIEELSQETISNAQLYAKTDYWSNNQSVNLMNVRGSIHPDYVNHSWLNLLNNGKRMEINQRLLAETPEYYYETTKKSPTMYYICIDGNVNIYHDGNHRTCLAKFLHYYNNTEPIIHGIEYIEYTTNKSLRSLVEQFRAYVEENQLSITIEVKKELVRREDGDGWKRDYFDINVVIRNNVSSFTVVADELILLNIMEETEKPLKSWFGKFSRLWKK